MATIEGRVIEYAGTQFADLNRRIDALANAIGRVLDQAEHPITGGPETTGPSDYQQWRDALDFAVRRLGNEGTREELLDLAEWFWEKLDDGPFGAPFKPMTGCEECGSQSGSHMGGCSKLGRF